MGDLSSYLTLPAVTKLSYISVAGVRIRFYPCHHCKTVRSQRFLSLQRNETYFRLPFLFLPSVCSLDVTGKAVEHTSKTILENVIVPPPDVAKARSTSDKFQCQNQWNNGKSCLNKTGNLVLRRMRNKTLLHEFSFNNCTSKKCFREKKQN